MKEWQVFAHLESCPGPTTERKSPERNAISQLGAAQRQHNKSLERLPALSYGMLKDNALRKKMAELGISNQGPRVLLEKRHREWITLWNANCDAAWPKRRSELLRDLDMWERTQGGRAPTAGRATQNATVIKDKDFDGSAWAAKHDTSFRDLIASAQKSSAQAKKKPDTEETSQDEKPEENEIPQVSSAPLAEDVQMDSGVQETEAALDLGGNPPNQPDGPGHPVETTQPLPAELEVESTEEWKDVNHPGPSVCAP